MSPILALVIGIALLLFLVIKTKIHAFPALIVVSILIGLLCKLSVADTIAAVTGGFGNTLGSIGIVIGFGCIMGQFLEKSGAAKRMATTFLKIFGEKNVDVALGITGLVVSIPVFCDSGFVILSELAKSLSRATKKSMVQLGGILGMGLYITHFMVPPTPGPLAVAGFFNIDLGLMIVCGILISIPLFIFALFYFRKCAKKYPDLIPADIINDTQLDSKTKEKLINNVNGFSLREEESLPGTFLSFAPVVIPIFLILLNTLTKIMGWEGMVKNVLTMLGNPVVAIFIGVLISIYGLTPYMSKEETMSNMQKAMADAGLIVLVTGAGGALGNVIKVTEIGNNIAQGIVSLHIPVIMIPLLLGTALRIPQGSGTVAMITAGSILAPMLGTLGLNPLMAGLSICMTSMCLSYLNDSYFWVVTNFSGLNVKTSLKTWTLGTVLVPIIGSIIIIVVNSIFF